MYKRQEVFGPLLRPGFRSPPSLPPSPLRPFLQPLSSSPPLLSVPPPPSPRWLAEVANQRIPGTAKAVP